MRRHDFRTHEYFKELSALAAGGQLSGDEVEEWLEHSATCPQCKADYQMFAGIHDEVPPLALKHRFTFSFSAAPPPPLPDGLRDRFLARMRGNGVRFSDDAELNGKSWWRSMLPAFTLRRVWVTTASIIAVAALTAGLIRLLHRLDIADVRNAFAVQERSSAIRVQHLAKNNSELRSRLEEISRANDEKTASLSRLQAALASDASSLRALRAELRTAAVEKKLSDDARDTRLADVQIGLQQAAQQLAKAENELRQARAASVQNEATVVDLQTRVTELSQQLRGAQAVEERERELLQADRDIRNIMGARNLHIVDVIDTDGHGNKTRAFGRVFYTEGKSLLFYAYDLSESQLHDAKYCYQVWGQKDNSPSMATSLGLLYEDERPQRRWILKVDDPSMLRSISTVFVTIEPYGGADKPQGRKMLYAFLGTDANHP